MSSSTSVAVTASPRARASGWSEGRKVTSLLGAAVLAGGVLQLFVEPGPKALVVAAALSTAAVLVLAKVFPGRWRETLAGFRFTAALLFTLGACAVLGTLVLQGRPLAEYPARYGLAGDLIVLLRLDDVFHSLWFGCLLALFLAGVVSSATLRWPPRLRNAGFLTCHAGLVTCLVGAGLSSYFSVRGRVDLLADGSTAREVQVTRGGQVVTRGVDAGGAPVAATAPLGFELRLDRFQLVRYATEYRVGYYEPRVLPDGRADWQLKASFDPEPGVRHVLPSGNAFTLTKLWTDYHPGQGDVGVARGKDAAKGPMPNPAAVLDVEVGGRTGRSEPLVADAGGNFVPVAAATATGPHGMLVFERREEEARSYRSDVTAIAGGREQRASVAVNEPFSFGGWTFYQASFDPRNPRYSGLDAVHDPGVAFVFTGFALIALGVFAMFYLEGRVRGGRRADPGHRAEPRAAA